MSKSSITRSTSSAFACLEPQSNRSEHKTNDALVHLENSSPMQQDSHDLPSSLNQRIERVGMGAQTFSALPLQPHFDSKMATVYIESIEELENILLS